MNISLVCSILKAKHTTMANFDITIGKDGQNYLELLGKLYPCTILTASERLRDPEAFQVKMKTIHEDVQRRLAQSEVDCRNKFLD